jgi:hypothetical protein
MGLKENDLTKFCPSSLFLTVLDVMFFCVLFCAAGYEKLEIKRNIRLSLRRRLLSIKFYK